MMKSMKDKKDKMDKMNFGIFYTESGKAALENMARMEILIAMNVDDTYKCASDIVRDVSACYAKRRDLLNMDGNVKIRYVMDWLKGIPMRVMFVTYDICVASFLALRLTMEEAQRQVDLLSDSERYELDCLYWHNLGSAVMRLYQEETIQGEQK